MRNRKLSIISRLRRKHTVKRTEEITSQDNNLNIVKAAEADIDLTIKSSQNFKSQFIESMKSIKEAQVESIKSIA